MERIAANLKLIHNTMNIASSKRMKEYQYCQPRLVAVSKLQSPSMIIEAYKAGQRHFGENYVNELVEKGNLPEILNECKEIQWHFIGHLQRNKVNKVLSVPHLYIIETVDDEKIATALNNAWPKFSHENSQLKIMVQVNTSKESEKNGCEIDQVPMLIKHIMENCEHLELKGLMTIGMFGYETKNGPNPDFLNLQKCREDTVKEFGFDYKNIELSMGMSNDYEHAIELGSTNVRVGSGIFGERPQKHT